MLDINMFREHADVIRADHDRRELTHENIDEVIRLDEEWRRARYDADQLRKARNEAARGLRRLRNRVTPTLLTPLWRKSLTLARKSTSWVRTQTSA